MDRPRIRHIAINVEDREKAAQYYKDVFKLEEKERGPNCADHAPLRHSSRHSERPSKNTAKILHGHNEGSRVFG
jgi:catechol 2,3-dioxygenase-like lactoylglutathione lyase family enzyme